MSLRKGQIKKPDGGMPVDPREPLELIPDSVSVEVAVQPPPPPAKGPEPELYVTVTGSLRDPYTKIAYNPHTPMPAGNQNWLRCQIEARVIKVYKPEG